MYGAEDQFYVYIFYCEFLVGLFCKIIEAVCKVGFYGY